MQSPLSHSYSKVLIILSLLFCSCSGKKGLIDDEYIGKRDFRLHLDCRDSTEAGQLKSMRAAAELTLREEYSHFTIKPDSETPGCCIITIHNSIDKPKGAYDARRTLKMCEFIQNRGRLSDM